MHGMRLTHAHAIEKREKDVTQYPICIISYKSSFYNDVIVCIPGYSVLVIMSYVMWLTIVSVAVSVSVTVRLRNNIGQRLPPWTGNLPRYNLQLLLALAPPRRCEGRRFCFDGDHVRLQPRRGHCHNNGA